MYIPQVEIPKSKDEIIEQILALEWLLTNDNNTDKEIHYEALHKLRMALSEFGEV